MFGSDGSNRDVVQLLDFKRVSARVATVNLESLIEGATHLAGSVDRQALRALVLDERLRDDPRFVSPEMVAYRCRRSGSLDFRFRYMDVVEAWFEDLIPESAIAEALQLEALLEKLRTRERAKE